MDPITNDPQALPGRVEQHDSIHPIGRSVGSPAPNRERVVSFTPPEGTRLWHLNLRCEVHAQEDATLEQVIRLFDAYMVGERGPHIPVILYTIDEEPDANEEE